IELLAAAEKQAVAANASRAELGRIRSRMAVQRIALGQPTEAVAAYAAALDDLNSAHSPDTPRAAADLLRFALLSDKYDGPAATRLASDKLAIDGESLWGEVRPELEALVRRESVDRCISLTTCLAANPPACFSAATRQEVDRLSRRARDLRAELDADQ